MEIVSSLYNIWESIEIIVEQEELLEQARGPIDEIKDGMGNKPSQPRNIIKFLNTKTREELEELGIKDIIDSFLQTIIVMVKENLMLQMK